MIIYYDRESETVNFGVATLKQAYEKKSVFYLEKPLKSFTGKVSEKSIVASYRCAADAEEPDRIKSGGFEIKVEGKIIFITGGDHVGLMYGLFDAAETIELFGVDAIRDKLENPFMKMRGIKFNLPFEPYTNGDPFERNIKTCKDISFWKKFIDSLALNRYNCLSLWSEHPFHMMFRLEKYPETCPYPDGELQIYKQLFKFILGYAKSRGIDVYIITWNIRLSSFIAKGLGLPEEFGNGYKTGINYIPTDFYHSEKSMYQYYDYTRQQLDVVKDYFKECIKTLVMTYPDLKGLGTNAAEEMAGSAEERHQWVTDVYIQALNEIGSKLPFIIRTNCGNGKVAKDVVLDHYSGNEKYISWKYSNAHMYSHPLPQFEKLWNAWDGVDINDIKIIYTVRNDDFNTLRWGNPDYIKAYVKGMQKPNVHGFYWGSDGYLWGEDFQHVPNGHKTWKYDFEKHWYQFSLLGRIGYNAELDDRIWEARFRKCYSEQWGSSFYSAMKNVSEIIPAVNRLFWIDYDFQWHPESLLSRKGFKSILDFVNGTPMPGIGTIGIREYVALKLAGGTIKGETPEDIIEILKASVSKAELLVESLEKDIPAEYLGGDILCTLSDIKAWCRLGEYYYNKFSAALELAFFEKTGEAQYRENAVFHLKEGLVCWKKLSEIWAEHYMPYKMARTGQIFGYSYYTYEVEMDIRLAEEFTCTASTL
jgi:hypothetical protein